MAFIDTSQKSSQVNFQNGNFTYILLLTFVATLGGLLFGYDTAVVNGAERSLVRFYIGDPDNFNFVSNIGDVIYQYRLILTSVLLMVSIIIGAQLIKLLGKQKGIFVSAFIVCIVVFWAIIFIRKPIPVVITEIKDSVDAIKGFLISSALIGCVIGGALSGYISNSWGRKKGLIIAALAFLISGIGSWRPELFNFFGILDMYSFVIYRIIGGIGVGIASMISPMYIAEISPANIRGKLVSFNQFAIILGMLIIYFVNFFIARNANEVWLVSEGWRLMFFSGVVPSILFLILLFFVPETPRYLAMKGKDESALMVLEKIAGKDKAQSILQEIKSTIKEKHAPWLSFGFLVIFIGIMLSVFQQFVGINVVLYYAGNIFRNMGASSDSSMMQTIIVGAVNLLFTVVAIIYVDKFGRKPLMIIGSIGMALSMIALGFAFYFNKLGIMALLFMLIYTAAFAMSWGPVCWVLLAEIFPNSIRGALSIAVTAQWIANWIVSLTFPILNDNVWLSEKFNHGFPYWIYGIMSVLSAIFVWKLVPETKGKSLESMEDLWKK
jgi:SP family xylose:H+ symportor-like MFS transporter